MVMESWYGEDIDFDGLVHDSKPPPSLAGIESLMSGLSVIFGIGLEQISFSNVVTNLLTLVWY